MADAVVFGDSRLEQLPSNILKLIMFKVDFKTVRNCKLLTKAFASLISTLILDPSFIQALVVNSPVSFIMQTEDTSGSLTFIDDTSGSTNFRVCLDDYEKLNSPNGCHTLTTINVNANLPVFKHGKSHILGSCNGLLLMKHKAVGFQDCFFLCNPLLGEWVKVPSCTRRDTLTNEVFGLFFDSMTTRYAVLRILKFSDKDPEAEIHTLGTGTGTWTSIIANDLLYPDTKRIDDVRLNGALHWVAFDGDGNLSVCSFHVQDKNFNNISPPWTLKHSRKTTRRCFELGVLWDCLCLCENIDVYASPYTCVWIMKKYGDVDTWIEVLSMSNVSIPNAKDYAFFSPRLRPVSSLKNGEILMLCWGTRVVCYNPQTRKLRGVNFEEDVISAYPWVPSFISLRNY